LSVKIHKLDRAKIRKIHSLAHWCFIHVCFIQVTKVWHSRHAHTPWSWTSLTAIGCLIQEDVKLIEKARAPKRVSVSGVTHIVTWMEQTWIKHQWSRRFIALLQHNVPLYNFTIKTRIIPNCRSFHYFHYPFFIK
jgi:hypothetical protein